MNSSVKSIDRLLAAWSIKTLQEFINVWDTITPNGKTAEDVRQYLKDSILEFRKRSAQGIRSRHGIFISSSIVCPDCGYPLALYSVNTSSEDQVGKEFRSMWLCGTSCSGKGCWYEEYNKESVNEILAKLANGGK